MWPLSRPSTPVEGAAGHPGHHLVELFLTAGRGGGDAVHVGVDVEVGVVDPDRMVQRIGGRDDAASEGRQALEVPAQHLPDPLERVAAVGTRRVDDGDLHRV